jgi:hypothetical protein
VVQHFILTASRSFLLPVFPRTALLAQHHGVVPAASRAPDEHVGTGAAYHLFRLPEDLEHGIHPAFQDGRGAGAALKGTGDRDAALFFLIRGRSSRERLPGKVRSSSPMRALCATVRP